MWLVRKKAIILGFIQVKITSSHSLGQSFPGAFPYSLGQVIGHRKPDHGTQEPEPCTKPDYKPRQGTNCAELRNKPKWIQRFYFLRHSAET